MQDLKLECRPMETLEAEAAELAKEHLKEIKLQRDGFTGSIANEGYKLMFISIPYDEGWTAIIDGVKARIYKANEGFMAVKLEPGEHTVEFRYKRPLQTAGYVVSILGIAGYIAYVNRRKNGGKPRKRKDEDDFYDDEDDDYEESDESLEDETESDDESDDEIESEDESEEEPEKEIE